MVWEGTLQSMAIDADVYNGIYGGGEHGRLGRHLRHQRQVMEVVLRVVGLGVRLLTHGGCGCSHVEGRE